MDKNSFDDLSAIPVPYTISPLDEMWFTDYEGKCGNCHGELKDGEKYCRYCGTKRGDGKFEPYQNLMQCIYGPMPVKRVRKCTNCSKTWETMLMIDHEDYCPDCGAPTEIIEEDGQKPRKRNNFGISFK